MAKANLGTKRVCPETSKKFYDLEKDPIVSPYTGKEYPLSFFEGEDNIVAPKPQAAEKAPEKAKPEASSDDDDDLILDDDGPEIISLDDAEEADDDDVDGDDVPDIPDIPDIDDGDDDAADDDTFLEDDDEDDDLSDVIVGVEKDDDDS